MSAIESATGIKRRGFRLLSVVVPLLMIGHGVVSCGGGGSGTAAPTAPPAPPAPTAQSFSIAAPGTSLLTGDKVQLSATASYSDGSKKDVIASTTWSITPSGAATVSPEGVLAATSAGTFSVTGLWNSLNSLQTFYASSPLYTPGENGFNWESVNTQGMGYVTGLVIHPLAPYDIYVRTDVGGAYRFDRANQRWMPLLDRFGPQESEHYGVESIAIDPQSLDTVYIAVPHGRTVSGSNVSNPAEVMVSHDKGATWEATGLANANIFAGPNDAARGMTGERLAVDPYDGRVLFFASRKDGLWRGVMTGSQSAAWTQVSGGLPAPATQPGVTFVVFDPAGGKTSAGATRIVYAGVAGSGVFASTDGGVTWAKIAATPNPGRANVAGDGTLLVSFGGDESATSGGLGRYKAGVWSDITPSGVAKAYSGITSDPSNSNIIMAAVNGNQQIFRSSEQGTTWSQVVISPKWAYQPAYYLPNSASWGNAALVIDPASPRRVWQTNGYGVIETEDITAASTTWTWQMANLEELVAMKVKAPPVVTIPGTTTPGADLMSVVADMVGFRHASRDMVPTSTVDSFQYVAQGSGITYCAQHPENAAFIGWDETNVSVAMSGVTADNGLTWKHLSNTTPGSGGKIAMSADDPKKMVWAPHNATPVYTVDGGNTWTKATTGGSPLPPSWQISNEWWNGDVLTADLVAKGTFYYFNNGDFYTSTDYGATWSKSNINWPVDPHFAINVNIIPSPVKSGDIWLSIAPNSNQNWTYPLLRSTDGGKSFAQVSTLTYANLVAFGRGSASDTPDVYVHGRVPGDAADAIYRSEDLGASWTRISDPAHMQFGAISGLEGDMRTRDLVYVAMGGRGIVFGYGGHSGIKLARARVTNQH